MLQQITRVLLMLGCIVLNIAAMDPKIKKYKKIKEPENILELPRYYSEITEKLQNQAVYYNHKKGCYRILQLNKNEDCQIISILSENLNRLPQKLRLHYPLSITSLHYNTQCAYKYNTYNNKKQIYAIISPAENQNFLTRRACFQVIDILQRGWIPEHADAYYTHPDQETLHKTTLDTCHPLPHKDDKNWLFFSKRTEFLPYKESNLIKYLANRFGMEDAVICRYTKTHDTKRIAAIHLWVLKDAFEQFKKLFDFEFSEPRMEPLCHRIATDHSHDNSKRLNSDHCSTISAGHVASISTIVVPT